MPKTTNLSPKLLKVYGQPNKRMLEVRALQAQRDGRCVIEGDTVRFYTSREEAGYDSGPAILRWSGRKSGAFGPQVMQAIRC